MDIAIINFEKTIIKFQLFYKFPPIYGTPKINHTSDKEWLRKIPLLNKLPEYAAFKTISFFNLVYISTVCIIIVFGLNGDLNISLGPLLNQCMTGCAALLHFCCDTLFFSNPAWVTRGLKGMSKNLVLKLKLIICTR